MKLIGHVTQRESLKNLFIGGDLPGTILLSGVAGIGKLGVAYELGRSLLCTDGKSSYGGCGSCPACLVLKAGNHPDFVLIQSKDSNTNSIKELLYSLNLRSFAGGNRVVILNDVEELSHQALNALLKTLEEPKLGNYFILIASNRSKLPATVISRCQTWFFDELSSAEIAQVLSQKEDQDTKDLVKTIGLESLATMASGSLDNIGNLSQHLEYWQIITDGLDAIFGGSVQATLSLAKDLSKDKAELGSLIHLVMIHARRRMYGSNDSAARARWALCLTNVIEAERLIFDRNISSNAVLANVLVDLLPQSDHELARAEDYLINKLVVG